MDERIIEICRECGTAKVAAIKKVRETFNLDLVTAKKKVDEAYQMIDPDTLVSPSGFFEKKKYNKENLRKKNDQHMDEIRYDFQIIAGRELINNQNNSFATLWQYDGTVYFGNDENNFYNIVEFEWNGPQYKVVTNSKTVGNEKGKQKRKGRFIGAAVGTMLLPGVGTVIGAAHGTGNKKNKKDIVSNTYTTEENIEVPSPAKLKLQNVESGEIIKLMISCKSEIASRLSLAISENESSDANYSKSETIDPYEEVKKAKELLDMGIITQEEFDIKKKQLLGL